MRASETFDTQRARQHEGAVAVLTAADLAADGVGDLPTDRARKRRDGTWSAPHCARPWDLPPHLTSPG
jgi:hypothetical protein